MSIRPTPLLLPLILLVTWSSLGCEHDDADTLIGPSSIRASDARFVSRLDTVDPREVVAVAAPVGLCPLTQPFFAPLSLTVFGNGVSDTTLRRVQMQFTDIRGTLAGSQTFTHAHLTTLFGSTAISALGARTFPLSFPFGCVGVPFGTLNVVAVVADADGRERRSSHTVSLTAP